MVAGFCDDRQGPLPSLLPSETHIFCLRGRWSDLRGVDSFDLIVNQPTFYLPHLSDAIESIVKFQGQQNQLAGEIRVGFTNNMMPPRGMKNDSGSTWAVTRSTDF